MRKGTEATKGFLEQLTTHCQRQHVTLRQVGDGIFEAINQYRAEILLLQTKLQKAELAETDPSIAGKFESMRGRLRTADRIAQEASVAVSNMLREFAALEHELADVESVAVLPAKVGASS